MSAKRFPGIVGTSWRESRPWLEPAPSAPPGAPNVVLVVLDDVGFAHLGCYGSTIETPRLDALAAAGRRYCNFHTTAMCSPTRASLLTGRNHHAVGMGMISDWCTGYPGYQGEISRDAPTLAELLRPLGYSCFAVGKWHLARLRDWTASGPFDQWPLGRGFERYYGFLASLSDHFHPELVCDNHTITTPRRSGYHLSEDLIEQAIAMIRSQQSATPAKPFFAYVALGACHSPHQAPRRCIDKYAGRFDEGWDVARQRWFARQLELGVVPPGTRLAPRDAAVQAWDLLSADERHLCARHQEVFAGFLDHADEQIGRLVDELAATGQLDNTLLVVLSDNGATEEGGAFGDANIRRHYQFLDEPLATKLAALDELGSASAWSNYPRGWGHAGNTPLKRFKMHTHGGGVRDPLIVHWPARIRDGGLVSAQFCHCSDIVPTVLEAVGAGPAPHHGAAPAMDGTSLLYTFDESDAACAKPIQYFELMGNRGIWAGGWKAVTGHRKGERFEDDRWELYHLDSDFAEIDDLAEREPRKLQELVQLWWQEAERNRVLPLDDRGGERGAVTYHLSPRRRYVYRPGGGRISGVAAPALAERSYRIAASATIAAGSAGVILAAGNRFGGYVLYVIEGQLVYEHAAAEERFIIESQRPLPYGRVELGFRFRRTGPRAGIGQLFCDDTELGSMAMTGLWPFVAHAGGVYCGRDDGSPASDRYEPPFTFSGVLHEVVIELGDETVDDAAAERAVLLAED